MATRWGNSKYQLAAVNNYINSSFMLVGIKFTFIFSFGHGELRGECFLLSTISNFSRYCSFGILGFCLGSYK